VRSLRWKVLPSKFGLICGLNVWNRELSEDENLRRTGNGRFTRDAIPRGVYFFSQSLSCLIMLIQEQISTLNVMSKSRNSTFS